MGEIKVRRLEDWVVGVHRELAAQEGQSLEEYMRALLKKAALRTQRRFAKDARAHLDQAREQFGVVRSSVDVVREQREDS